MRQVQRQDFFGQFRHPSQASDVAHIKFKNRQMKEDEKSSIMHVLSGHTGEVRRRTRNEGRMDTRRDTLVLNEACEHARRFAVSVLNAVSYRGSNLGDFSS